MALSDMGFDAPMLVALHDMLDFVDDAEKPQHPSRAYIRDTKAMKATPVDIIEYPNAYQFVVDMPGLKSDQIKVHLEDSNVLVVSGERRREKEKDEKEGVKYVRMERRFGKLLKKFVLPENANLDKICAVCQDGVLTVTVEKKPPPEPKKPKVIEFSSKKFVEKA
ncbi:17.6 kDa class II heat shock protein [Forsythia ovata]|uniref:17.6 kDa class II heat shock protein n=1 Tax=Forsythia ovata TaxID=205694 RepID=A0ABD1RMH4_9LAMI